MSWFPIAFFPPQFENSSGLPYSGAVLKAYAAGTNTVIPMATGFDGVTTASSFALNASGYPSYNGSVIIPHVQENYKLALYPNQAAADANSGSIWNPDDIQIADETNTAFVAYFDGDGSNATFTLSEDLGTDEKVLMVFADRQLPNYVTNGTFATDTVWTKGAGWTIGAGVATATGAISTDITENASPVLIAGESYTIQFDVTRSAGGVIPKIGGTSGTERTATGTYKETIIAGSTQALTFSGNAFTGTLDNVTVKPTYAARRQILRPIDDYTLNGNSLVLMEAPPSGTKNVIVFAPSLLLGAANNAAAAAATSETNAAASAAAAATSATLAAVSIKWRPAVATATTANITLSGEQTIDGVLTSASRVLVKNQTAPAENGVYVSAAGAWTRATDADTWDELVNQAVTSTGGTVNAKHSYGNTNSSGGTLGTTAVTWTEILFYPAASSVVGDSLNDSVVNDVTTVTAASGDYVLGSDVSDSNKKKKFLVSDIVSLSSGAGFVNKFYNGTTDIWHLGTSGTITGGAAPAYTADGWMINCEGANGTWAQVAGRGSTKYALKFTGNTSLTTALVQQRIESYLAAGLYNGAAVRVTIQAKIYNGSGASITPTLDVSSANAADNFAALTAIVTAASLQACPNATLTTVAYTFDTTAAVANGLQVRINIPSGALNANTKSIEVTEFDIRVTPGVATGLNSSPPTPELRGVATEMTLCQRYYEKSFTLSVAPAQNTGDNNGELEGIAGKAGALSEYVSCRFMTRKRVAPTITLYNPAAANAQMRDLIAAADCSATSAGQISETAFRVTATGNASTAVGNLLAIHWQADARL